MAPAAAVKRASSTTNLAFGMIRVPIGLYKTTADPKAAKFDTAGPNGGVLRQVKRAVESSTQDTPEDASPLAVKDDKPTSDASLSDEDRARQVAAYEAAAEEASVPGEFRNVLVEEGSDVEVTPEQVRRGLRQGDKFLDLTDGLKAIDEQTKLDEMRVVAFIDVGQVPRERATGSYYVGSADEGVPKVLRLLYEAMKLTRRVGVVKWTKATKQSLGVLVPHSKTGTLVVLEVKWAENWRAPNPRCLSLQQAEVSATQVDQAAELIRAMSDTKDAMDELRDDAIVMREELIEKAETGDVGDFKVPERPEADEEDLAAVLEMSVAAVKNEAQAA